MMRMVPFSVEHWPTPSQRLEQFLRRLPRCPSTYGRKYLFTREFFNGMHDTASFEDAGSLVLYQYFLDTVARHADAVQNSDPDGHTQPVVRSYYADVRHRVSMHINDITNGVVHRPSWERRAEEETPPFPGIPSARRNGPLDAAGISNRLRRLRRRIPVSHPYVFNDERCERMMRVVLRCPDDDEYPDVPSLVAYLEHSRTDSKPSDTKFTEIYEVPGGAATARIYRLLAEFRALLTRCVYPATIPDPSKRVRESIDQIFELLWYFPCGDPSFFTENEFPMCREMLSHLWFVVTSVRLTLCGPSDSPHQYDMYVPFALLGRTYGSAHHWVRLPDFDAGGGPNIQTSFEEEKRWTEKDGTFLTIQRDNRIVQTKKRRRSNGAD